VIPVTTSEQRRAAAKKVRAAEEAAGALRDELRMAGVTLPSLRIDPVSCARDEPEPLIDLGRCNLATALRLAAILRGQGRQR
jgi:hypothetical protein